MIELKITGDNASDVMKHLAELTGGFLSMGVDAPPPEPVAEDKPRRGRKPKAEEPEGNAPSSATQTADAGQTEEETTSAPAEPTDPAASLSDTALDFDKDVAPIVLKYVREKGKPWVVDVLAQFGVKRASELEQAQWPELLAALNDAA
ncbi:MAG: hypothetical protein KGL39_42160 [Patescibacteria group bacterium]|nr:hypothetical protein [Patescibacteria group bacterium]